MKKNDIVKGVCSSYTYNGHGVVKIDGFPLFVKDVLVDEEVELIVTLVKKSYGYGKIAKIIQPSAQRVSPPCPIYQQCGGCQLQHMSAQEQARFKQEQVANLMSRVAKIEVETKDVLSMEDPWHYRNKSQVPVGENGQCGFYRLNSNTIIDMDACLIQSERINEVYRAIKAWVQTYPNPSDLRHILIKDGFETKEVMVVIIAKVDELAMQEALLERLQAFEEVKSVYLNVNKREDNVILGEQDYLLWGKSTITDKLKHLVFEISPKSFYQVNPIQTLALYEEALHQADLQGHERVLDLYCGIGTITMFLAQKAKEVVGIEIVPAAIEDATRNARVNGLDNVSFVCSDAGSYASALADSNEHFDVIVVDPPRKGCDIPTIEAIASMAPEKVVYVSCDPSTLARDIERFKAHGYACENVQPVDMFPQTYHVESVVLLTRGNS
ncbi:MAG: 23S rRNA (uracil(1939)-C(5))-methyltransferase RlmD [Erysipelotrichaceae bacterium]